MYDKLIFNKRFGEKYKLYFCNSDIKNLYLYLHKSKVLLILVLLFNSSYALTFHNQNKLYFGQSRTMLELNSTEVEPIYIMENQEIWKDVVGYEGLYKVSNNGFVKNLSRYVLCKGNGLRKIKSCILKPNISDRGYYSIQLCKEGTINVQRVHRIVAFAFIPNPENKKEINHINGIKNDNRVENLEWATRTENAQHAVNTGLSPIGVNHPYSNFTKDDILEIRQSNLNNKYLAEKYNVSRHSIWKIIKMKTYKSVL